MDAVAEMGRIVKQTAELTADRDAFGCAKLVIFCNPVEDNPFMAGASMVLRKAIRRLASVSADRALLSMP